MDYRIHLKQFDGPLDLLLHLIERADLDIKDIFVSQITSEFLGYMNELDELDMDTASEFLTVAATLVYMKSRSLFPAVKPENEEEEDPGDALIKQLQEYKRLKEASENMRELAHEASFMRTKKPEEFPLPPKRITLKDTNTDSLFRALLTVLARFEEPAKEPVVHNVSKAKYTVRACTREIRARLTGQNGRTDFEELTAGAEKAEVIVIFMSLLEMVLDGEIRISQKSYYGNISIKALNLIENDENKNYMDEDEAEQN